MDKAGTTEEVLANDKIGFETGYNVRHPFIKDKKIPIYLQILY